MQHKEETTIEQRMIKKRTAIARKKSKDIIKEGRKDNTEDTKLW